MTSVLQNYIKTLEDNTLVENTILNLPFVKKNIYEKSSLLEPLLGNVTKQIYDLAHNSYYFILLFNYKFLLLSKAIVYSIENDNPLSLANNLRSLIEQFSVYNYCMDSAYDLINNLRDTNDYKTIEKYISKPSVLFERAYLGEKSSNYKTNITTIHINDALKYTSTSIPNIYDVYEELCEFVHPNYSGNLLISSGVLGIGCIKAKEKENEVVNRLITISNTTINILTKKSMSYAIVPVELFNLVEKCLSNNVKITNVFSQKDPMPKGDGKTIMTAYYFDKARTHEESISLEYKFLKSINVNTDTSKKTLIIVKEDYIIEQWETLYKILYFKIKL